MQPFIVEKGKKGEQEEIEADEDADDELISTPENEEKRPKFALRKGCEKQLRAALAAFRIEEKIADQTIQREIRRIRIGKANLGDIPIKDRRTGAVYKALLPGENHHIDIVQMRDGTWEGITATVFEVNQPDYRPVWEREKRGGKLVMRLHKGDMIEVYDPDGQRRIKTVHVARRDGTLYLAGHNEGGELQKRHDNKEDLFRWDFAKVSGLKKRNARKVKVDEMGSVLMVTSNIIPAGKP